MSWQARVVESVLRAASSKGAHTADELRQELARRPTEHRRPGRASRRGVVIAADEKHGMPIYRVRPRRGTTPVRAVLYLHGGSYTFDIASVHWLFVRRLAVETPCDVHVPVYPLAPETTAASTVAAVAAVLADLVTAYGAEQVVVAGDSAGGGMALAVAQLHRDGGGPPVDRLVLVSPWLDVATDDPLQRDVAPRDLMLRPAVLQEAGRLYAGGLPLDDPRVSPLYGDLTGLPPVEVFVGTHDILHVDALRLRERASAVGADVRLHEAPGMQHVFPVIPLLPEGRSARREIVRACRGR